MTGVQVGTLPLGAEVQIAATVVSRYKGSSVLVSNGDPVGVEFRLPGRAVVVATGAVSPTFKRPDRGRRPKRKVA